MPYNPFDQYFDTGRFGGTMPRRTYSPNHGGNPYVGQYRADNYRPARYQPSYNYPTYEKYADNRTRAHPGSYNQHRDDHDTQFYDGYSSTYRDREPDVPRARFRDGPDSEVWSYQHNPTSLRGVDGSSIGSRTHRRWEDTSYFQPQTYRYEETIQPPNRHAIYTTPRCRDAIAGWVSRGNRWGGQDVRRNDTDEDEIYRRARHRQESNERPRRSAFHRPSWFSRW